MLKHVFIEEGDKKKAAEGIRAALLKKAASVEGDLASISHDDMTMVNDVLTSRSGAGGKQQQQQQQQALRAK